MFKEYFNTIRKYIKIEKKYFILTIFAVVIETVFEVIIPLIMAYMLDSGVAVIIDARRISDEVLLSQGRRAIGLSGIGIAICATMSLLNGWIYARCSALAATKFGRHLREEQFIKIQSYSFSSLDKFEASALLTRVINDSNVVQRAIGNSLRPLIRAPLLLLLGIVFSFILSWQLALVFVVLSPMMAFIVITILRKVAPKYVYLQKKLDRLNSKIEENLVAIRAIKSFVRKDFECKEFDKENIDYKNTVKKTHSISNLNEPFFQLFMYGGTAILMFLGGNLIIDGRIETGSLTGILSYVLQVFNSLMMLSNVFINISKSLASIHRINEVFKVTSPIEEDYGQEKVKLGSIEFKNVSFKYFSDAEENVLDNINFKLDSGKTLGILGSTGSAKSTLINLIPRFYDVTKGEVLIDGKNVKDYDLNNLRSSIGVVFQNPVLYSGTIKENLELGNHHPDENLFKESLKISCVDEFIPRLEKGLDTVIGEGGSSVSGGQKQRLCLARALIKKPKILILDDATSAVDTATEKKIRTGLSSLDNMTKIIISQRVASVLEADLIMILKEGKVNDIGTPSDLLKRNEIYQNLYNVQLGGVESHGNR